MAKFTRQVFKSVINKQKFIDSWFWCRYSINTYQGCQYGCIYCNSRSEKYHLPEDFEKDIVVKDRLADLLDKRLSRARTLLPDVVVLSGVTDPYQPAESKFGNTRAALEVLAKHKFPVHIITKSTLVLKDLPLLEQIANDTWAAVTVSLSSIDEEKARLLDKRAPSVKKRLGIIETIKQKSEKIQAGISLMPIIPYFTDEQNELDLAFQMAKDQQADYLFFASMTLFGRQAQWFFQHIDQGTAEKIQNLTYNKLSGKYQHDHDYMLNLHQRLLALAQKHQLPWRMKRFLPNDYRHYNYLIAERLLNEAYDLQVQARPWQQPFWAGQNIQNLKESIVDMAREERLEGIKNMNSNLEARIQKFVSKLPA